MGKRRARYDVYQCDACSAETLALVGDPEPVTGVRGQFVVVYGGGGYGGEFYACKPGHAGQALLSAMTAAIDSNQ